MTFNNKTIGSNFEKQFCDFLAEQGFWAHFCEPNKSGSQPFDVIAVRDGVAYAFDCKTCIREKFSIARVEENQAFAMKKWKRCGNSNSYFAVLHDEKIHLVTYDSLIKNGSVELNESNLFSKVIY